MTTLSIVIPTLNSGQFIKDTLDSIADQRKFDLDKLEVVIVDGGSEDGTLDKLSAYKGFIKSVISRKDRGIYDALDTGFSETTGDIMTWISSNDIFHTSALHLVEQIFSDQSTVNFLTSLVTLNIDEDGVITSIFRRSGICRESFLDGVHTDSGYPYSSGHIQQEGTFWRRSLWNAAGAKILSDYGAAGDFNLWARFFEHSDIACVDSVLAYFRSHDHQTSQNNIKQYQDSAHSILKRAAKKLRHSARPTPQSGFRAYKMTLVDKNSIRLQDFVIIDGESQQALLKKIIHAGRIL